MVAKDFQEMELADPTISMLSRHKIRKGKLNYFVLVCTYVTCVLLRERIIDENILLVQLS